MDDIISIFIAAKWYDIDLLPQGPFKAIDNVETDFPDFFGAEKG